MVIPSLNRDGDLLSDMVLQMFGSIAGSESMVISVDQAGEQIDCIMAEAPHGKAPALEGRNVANPMGMILAAAGMLSYLKEPELKLVSRGDLRGKFGSCLRWFSHVGPGGLCAYG